MTKSIYDQHQATFKNVSAFVILDENHEVYAKVSIKYPRDGAGRLYAYVHIIGERMVRGSATGYGYDKGSAAVSKAFTIARLNDPFAEGGDDSPTAVRLKDIREALHDGSINWYDALPTEYTVIQVI